MEIEIEKQNNNCEIRNGLWLPKPTISQWPNDQQKHLREKYRNRQLTPEAALEALGLHQ